MASGKVRSVRRWPSLGDFTENKEVFRWDFWLRRGSQFQLSCRGTSVRVSNSHNAIWSLLHCLRADNVYVELSTNHKQAISWRNSQDLLRLLMEPISAAELSIDVRYGLWVKWHLLQCPVVLQRRFGESCAINESQFSTLVWLAQPSSCEKTGQKNSTICFKSF